MTALQEVRDVDDAISVNEDRVAELQTNIGNLKRKRADLFEHLSDEEKASLNPSPPAAPGPISEGGSRKDPSHKSP
jgi:hypothetical protein